MLQYMVKIQGYMFSFKKSYSIVFMSNFRIEFYIALDFDLIAVPEHCHKFLILFILNFV